MTFSRNMNPSYRTVPVPLLCQLVSSLDLSRPLVQFSFSHAGLVPLSEGDLLHTSLSLCSIRSNAQISRGIRRISTCGTGRSLSSTSSTRSGWHLGYLPSRRARRRARLGPVSTDGSSPSPPRCRYHRRPRRIRAGAGDIDRHSR
jgi:hypothetical protein